MILGSHMSIAGGPHRAGAGGGARLRDRGHVRPQPAAGGAAAMKPDVVEMFHVMRLELGINPVVVHGSYLVNLAGATLCAANP